MLHGYNAWNKQTISSRTAGVDLIVARWEQNRVLNEEDIAFALVAEDQKDDISQHLDGCTAAFCKIQGALLEAATLIQTAYEMSAQEQATLEQENLNGPLKKKSSKDSTQLKLKDESGRPVHLHASEVVQRVYNIQDLFILPQKLPSPEASLLSKIGFYRSLNVSQVKNELNFLSNDLQHLLAKEAPAVLKYFRSHGSEEQAKSLENCKNRFEEGVRELAASLNGATTAMSIHQLKKTLFPLKNAVNEVVEKLDSKQEEAPKKRFSLHRSKNK